MRCEPAAASLLLYDESELSFSGVIAAGLCVSGKTLNPEWNDAGHAFGFFA